LAGSYSNGFIYLNLFFTSSVIHKKNRNADLEEFGDMRISQQAIYTNDNFLCDDLKSPFGEACRLGFQRSYKLCQQRFTNNNDLDYFNNCIANVLHLSNDLVGCQAVEKQKELELCSWSYNNKYMVYAILREDKSMCNKIINSAMKADCFQQIDRGLESKAEYGEDSFRPDLYRYVHSDFRYDFYELYKNGKIIFQ
jgi:hypothetical protein